MNELDKNADFVVVAILPDQKIIKYLDNHENLRSLS
jgi:hypothetical protein